MRARGGLVALLLLCPLVQAIGVYLHIDGYPRVGWMPAVNNAAVFFFVVGVAAWVLVVLLFLFPGPKPAPATRPDGPPRRRRATRAWLPLAATVLLLGFMGSVVAVRTWVPRPRVVLLESSVTGIGFSADGRAFLGRLVPNGEVGVSPPRHGPLTLWDVKTGRVIASHDCGDSFGFGVGSSDGRLWPEIGSSPVRWRLVDLVAGQSDPLPGDEPNPSEPSLSRDARRMAFHADHEHEARVYERVGSGWKLLRTFVGVSRPRLSHDGRRLAAVQKREGETPHEDICVFDVEDGSEVSRCSGRPSTLRGFTDDDQYLIAEEDGHACLIDGATGNLVLRTGRQSGLGLAVGEGCAAAAVVIRGPSKQSLSLVRWDLTTGKQKESYHFGSTPLLLPDRTPPFAPRLCVVMPVPRSFESTRADERWEVTVYDPDSRRELMRFRTAPFSYVMLAPDGRTLAVVGPKHLEFRDVPVP